MTLASDVMIWRLFVRSRWSIDPALMVWFSDSDWMAGLARQAAADNFRAQVV